MVLDGGGGSSSILGPLLLCDLVIDARVPSSLMQLCSRCLQLVGSDCYNVCLVGW